MTTFTQKLVLSVSLAITDPNRDGMLYDIFFIKLFYFEDVFAVLAELPVILRSEDVERSSGQMG